MQLRYEGNFTQAMYKKGHWPEAHGINQFIYFNLVLGSVLTSGLITPKLFIPFIVRLYKYLYSK